MADLMYRQLEASGRDADGNETWRHVRTFVWGGSGPVRVYEAGGVQLPAGDKRCAYGVFANSGELMPEDGKPYWEALPTAREFNSDHARLSDALYRMLETDHGPSPWMIFVWSGTGPVKVYKREDDGKFYPDKPWWRISVEGGTFYSPDDGKAYWDAMPVCYELRGLRDGAPAEFLVHLGSHDHEVGGDGS